MINNYFYEAYADAIGNLRDYGDYVAHTKELLNYSFTVRYPNDWDARFLPYPQNWKYIWRELTWYFVGEANDLTIIKYAKRWREIAASGGINSNYGQYIFNDAFVKGGEFSMVLAELHDNADSRRAVMYLTPARVYRQLSKTADFPCTSAIMFNIRGDSLNMVVNMRSNDIILGLRNDYPFFMMLQRLMAVLLYKRVGTYTHNVMSLHAYEQHWHLLDMPYNACSVKSYPAPVITFDDAYNIMHRRAFAVPWLAEPYAEMYGEHK